MKLKQLKALIQNIPEESEAIFSKDIITFISGDNIYAINQSGATWENGIGYAPGGTVICGECSDFDCSNCGHFTKGE